MFDKNSKVTLTSNRAKFGTVYSEAKSHVTFKANCKVIFYRNSALSSGGAVFSTHSNISFENNAYTEFNNNNAKNRYYSGGAIYAEYTHLSLEDNSTTEFSNNRAGQGGAISGNRVYVSFEDNSTTEFSNNRVDGIGRADGVGGAIDTSYGHVSFEDNSTTKFSNNRANSDGGAISAFESNVSFEDNSATEFSNNKALSDIFAFLSQSAQLHIIFDGNSTVSFINDISTDGGIVYPISTYINHYHIDYKFEIIARGNFTITFNYQSVKWCTSTCLPYSGKDHYDVRIDNIGMVWCTHQDYFKCQSKNCQCKNLEDVTANITNNTLITLSDKVRLSSAVNLSIIQNNYFNHWTE